MYFLLLVAIFLGQTIAQADFSKLPSCAQNCLTSATSAQGGCTNLDVECLCSNSNYNSALACCIYTSCNAQDQASAISFTTSTCATFNVTVPNFVGCAPTSSKTSGIQSLTQVTLTKLSSMPITVSTATESIEQAMSVTSLGKVATFTGNALLAGSCTTPHFASVSMFGGSLLEFPIVGCSKEQPGCCPYDINAPGPLSVCPKDYTTTSSACCPSGWAIYTSELAGQTPCYTIPSLALVPRTVASSATTSSASVISSQLFTVKYSLQPPSSGPSAGTIAGAVVGGVVGLCLILALIFILLRLRRRKRLAKQENEQQTAWSTSGPANDDASTVRSVPRSARSASDKRSQAFSHTMNVSEMPTGQPMPTSPSMQARSERGMWSQSPNSRPRSPPTVPLTELPGDIHINQNHPAYAPGSPVRTVVPEREGEHDMVSPMEGELGTEYKYL